MGDQSFLANIQNTTWSVEVATRYYGGELGAIAWKRIPCHPDSVCTLEVSLDSSQEFRAIGDGGLFGIVRSLYDALNLLIHCGPKFDPRRRLQQSIHLKEIKFIVVERGDHDGRESSNDQMSSSHAFRELCSILVQLLDSALLCGYVDAASVSHADRKFSRNPTENSGQPGEISDVWKHYGYKAWGASEYHFPDNGASQREDTDIRDYFG